VKYIPLCLFLALFIYSCSQNSRQGQNNESSSTPEKVSHQKLIDDGISISTELQQTLAAHLKLAIEDSGVAYALNYCSLHAYRLTDSIAQLHGVTIKRVSHKARNPRNKAGESELSIINGFQASIEKGEPAYPKIIETTEGNTFFAPIVIQATLCLKCHGIPAIDIAPEDFIAIKMLYPKDEASGFKLNDLRGIWRIDFSNKQRAL